MEQPVFYDTHAHLDYPEFSDDLEGVIRRAVEAGISKIISIGTDFESSERAIGLAERHEMVYAAAGWHPSHALAAPEDVRPVLREMGRHPKVVGIGETGLDYHHLPSGKEGGTASDDQRYKEKQAVLFRQQLEVAAELGLNCVVHQRDALEDTLAEMEQYAGRVRGVFHCFVDGAEAMRRIVAIGGLVSFTGIVTFKNARSVRETLEATPLDQFMLETDCPFLAPAPYRGKRCEPAHVRQIAEIAAGVKGCTLEELSAATCSTASHFFRNIRREQRPEPDAF
jgi:TatD DNase family protein